MNWITIPQLADLAEDIVCFEQRLTALSSRLGLVLTDHRIDHIALRCRQDATAQRWFDGLRRCGQCLKTSEFNGRAIALFVMQTPISVGPLRIDCVELPWPGQRRYPHDGWEHIEIVLPGPPDTLAQRALALLADSALAAADISLKHSAPQDAGERLPNPTLAVTDGRVTIKFHPHSLRAIVGSEASGG
ncbi:VOC family protein [Acerihabitans arboris]|uniref:VOC family protein n=1 Tax=Acerihabitans arboris TaxID=2691583 RepID=A0A845SMV3_9GAMM|nr:VOC family protein [Acerihabitans arboris]NDL62575.1 VOC family protein [Acerihabitans arboris]